MSKRPYWGWCWNSDQKQLVFRSNHSLWFRANLHSTTSSFVSFQAVVGGVFPAGARRSSEIFLEKREPKLTKTNVRVRFQFSQLRWGKFHTGSLPACTPVKHVKPIVMSPRLEVSDFRAHSEWWTTKYLVTGPEFRFDQYLWCMSLSKWLPSHVTKLWKPFDASGVLVWTFDAM